MIAFGLNTQGEDIAGGLNPAPERLLLPSRQVIADSVGVVTVVANGVALTLLLAVLSGIVRSTARKANRDA